MEEITQQWKLERNVVESRCRYTFVTIWERTDNTYGIGSAVEVFDKDDNYIRDLTDEEMAL